MSLNASAPAWQSGSWRLSHRQSLRKSDVPSAILKHLKTSRDFTLRVADQMPEADYAFKLTPPQMSFPEQIVHLTQALDEYTAPFLSKEGNCMAKLSDLKLAYQVFMKAYPYRKVDWRPGARLSKALREARIAFVTTAAYFMPDQLPFDAYIRGGDCSYRVLPPDTALRRLGIAHRSDAFDIRGIASDKNLALPLDRLKSLVEEGVIGSAAPRHFSFMGSISAPGRLIHNIAPEVAHMLVEDGVDAVLLTPV